MKTFKILCISLFLATVCLSCTEDLLNPLPKDRLAKELFWQTEQDAVYAANGIYSLLGGHWRYGMMDAYADVAHVILQHRQESGIEKGVYNAANDVVANEWRYYYNIVFASSSFLENIDGVTMDGVIKKRLIAEAKTLRAFAYINLVMLYGDVPLVTTSLTVSEAKAISQTPASAIWNFISDELTAAAADLPPTYTTASDRGRITQGAALGLKARAMLYAGRWADAKAAAKAVMDLGVHGIYESYSKLFDYEGQGASEILFARQYAKDVSAHSMFLFLTANSIRTRSCEVIPTKPLVDAYLMKTTGLPVEDPASGFDPFDPYKDRDPRLSYTIFVTGDELPNGQILNTLPNSPTADNYTSPSENATKTGWYFKKWVSNADYAVPNNCGVNLIYLRYAEVLLTYAEASVELGGAEIDQSVLNALNAIRSRPDVDMPKITTLVQSELREIIRRERKVELAMEGLRLYDIRRWHLLAEVMPGPLKGMTYEDPENPGTLKTVSEEGYVKEFHERNYLWPLPFRELVMNPNLKQNDGY